MKTSTKSSHPRSSLHDIHNCFRDLRPPYGEGDIVRFNLIYQRVHPHLSPDEKRQAEVFIDRLLEELERKGLAPKLYGVI